MKKTILFVCILCSLTNSLAYDFKLNGIFYNKIQGTESVEVTHNGTWVESYEGKVDIPKTIIFENKTFEVKKIGSYAFSKCSKLTSVTIPTGITSIEVGAFQSCVLLTSLIIPDGVTIIGIAAFDGCTNLQSINLPSSVIEIGESTFNNCNRLSSITIPPKLSKINGWVFNNCTGIASLIIPDGVVSIGERAFFGCSGLKTINIPKNVKSIESQAFMECSGLVSFSIPNSIISISPWTFAGCKGLKSFIIPDNINSIGENAFSYCQNLEKVVISKNITHIGYRAFNSCFSLKSVEIGWKNPTDISVLDDIFEWVDLNKVELIVPEGTKHLYAVANVWKNFGNITSVSNETITPESITYSNGILKINNDKAERIDIYSITGQLIYCVQKTASSEKLYIGNLSPGFYIIHGQSGWNLKISI